MKIKCPHVRQRSLAIFWRQMRVIKGFWKRKWHKQPNSQKLSIAEKKKKCSCFNKHLLLRGRMWVWLLVDFSFSRVETRLGTPSLTVAICQRHPSAPWSRTFSQCKTSYGIWPPAERERKQGFVLSFLEVIPHCTWSMLIISSGLL